jgi:type I restriction enzyme S subunit
MLPDGWKSSRFDGVADIANGQVDPKGEPYCNYLHVGPENVETATGRIIAPELAKDLGLISGKYEFDQNSIVYSKIRPNLNKVCMPSFKGICSADMYPIHPKNHISKEYLFYAMQSPAFVSEAIKCSMRTGLPKINRQDLNRIRISYPIDKNEQVKVIEPIKKLDLLLSGLEKFIFEKKSQRQALMQRLLMGKQRFPEFEGQEWERHTFRDMFTPFKDVNTNNDDYEVLSVTKDGIVSQSEYFNKEVASEDKSLYLIVERDTLVMSGLNFWMGSIDFQKIRDVGIVSPAYKTFKPNLKGYDLGFLKHFVRSNIMKRFLIGASVQGASIVRRNLDNDMLMNSTMALPSKSEQQKIAAVLNAADKEIELLTQKLEAYQEQKKGLMQQLLTGKKRVNITKEAA